MLLQVRLLATASSLTISSNILWYSLAAILLSNMYQDLLSSKTPLTAIMFSPLLTINKNLLVEEAARIMIKNRVRHLAVEEVNDHHIIGLVSSTDLTRFLMDKLELRSDTSSLLKALYWEEEPLEEIDI
jgi:signal-transduction protein with cAMP-binding, CBS, and nucleotidyltransferase domain